MLVFIFFLYECEEFKNFIRNVIIIYVYYSLFTYPGH